ncbi:putative nonribosomal peptide synthase [Phaeomoniella chlamydospora]|uniref:Putative nonribosomal peptide synthase n=1 Tax=Phaeomoniella chlamydospora TaxID=158046 RepID=A0A0G2DZR6_PHACM|nr:putative nonribosomal peptide synthase [Phaeomoniella chlamydospora]
MGNGVNISDICQGLSDQYDINAELIEDVYPCSPLQEGLFSQTLQRPGEYIQLSALDITPQVSLSALRNAWEQILHEHQILRSRIVQLPRFGICQVVLKRHEKWHYVDDMDEYAREQANRTVSFGKPLTEYAIFTGKLDGGNVGKRFLWVYHHALYDGWFLSQIPGKLKALLSGHALKRQPQFKCFIKHLLQQNPDSSKDYWASSLDNFQASHFPTQQNFQRSGAMHNIETWCRLGRRQNTTVKMSTIIYGAWAMVVALNTGVTDVVFGTVLSGRKSLSRARLQEVTGPTIVTVPVRVRINFRENVYAFLEMVQQEGTERTPYEQTGLRNISRINEHTRRACEFQTLLTNQPLDYLLESDDDVGKWSKIRPIEQMTYGLSIQCTLDKAQGGIEIKGRSDDRFLNRLYTQRVLEQLSWAIQQLANARPNQLLSNINFLPPKDRNIIWEWNKTVPATIHTCVHELIEQRALSQPTAPAICAWDGDLTYKDLNDLSNRLAFYLINLGIRSEVIVPLCFEKSRWTSVAILAVLKAGGAFVLLEPSQPEARLRSIIQRLQPPVILTSIASHGLGTMLMPNNGLAVAVGLDSPQLPVALPDHRSLPVISASSLMYMVFTSGSTGTPKGVMISHSAFSSAVYHQSSYLSLSPTSRVLDFSAYSFDISIRNFFTTLSRGGCLCVPSEKARKDNITEFILTSRANTAHFTPSVARTLDPQDVPGLVKVLLGGEEVLSNDVQRWPAHVQVIIGYGPSECTPTSTLNSEVSGATLVPRIGKGVGAVTWVVDPADHDVLLPIGVIGELLLEGPIVGRGYLDDLDKTALAFIENPRWLLEGVDGYYPGRQGRLYKTGDLVRYNEDGSLTFVGRKDTQVKIRGQRVELGEVEHHVHACLPQAKELAAEVIVPAGQGASSMLAVFMTGMEDLIESDIRYSQDTMDAKAAVISLSAEIEDRLAECLPSYMVPTLFFSIRQLPLTATGKTDRKCLREIGSLFSTQQLAQLRSSLKEKRQPTTEIERTIQALWAHVLNIPLASIGLDDSFLRLGGDSITAMQVSSAARSSGLVITTGDILQKKSISRIITSVSLELKSSCASRSNVDVFDELFDLSPIQQLYFSCQHHKDAHFDQSFLLDLSPECPTSSLHAYLETLVQAHSMLRSRFAKDKLGRWKQLETRDAVGSFRFLQFSDDDENDMLRSIRSCRETLDIEHGPILVAALISSPKKERLFISIHHLAVDFVSWRIILGDLETLFSGQTLQPSHSVSFQTWCRLQAEYAARSLQSAHILPFSIQQPFSTYWHENVDSALLRKRTLKKFTIPRTQTQALLNQCNEPFQTRPVELMIAGLLFAFSRTFTDRTTPAVFCEAHGREPWDDSIDISRTVGWFTTIFPVQITKQGQVELTDIIRQVKDCVRRIPDNGWAFFTSSLLSQAESTSFLDRFPTEVLFNYSGLYQQLERPDAKFRRMMLPEGCDVGHSLREKSIAIFDVGIQVEEGSFVVSISHPPDLKHHQEILSWTRLYEDTLKKMAGVLLNAPRQWTLCDFSLAFNTYNDLDEFTKTRLPQLGISDLDSVEDVFPCSPMQEAILVSQARAPYNYRSCLVAKVAPAFGEERVDAARIQYAWKSVVARHPILRAILVPNMPGISGIAHIVLKHPQPSISSFRIDKEKADHKVFRAHYDPVAHSQETSLQHHLSVGICNNGDVYICLEINHAISDGFSVDIILRELQEAYAGTLQQDLAVSYCEFLSYLKDNSDSIAGDFWDGELIDAEPCLLPVVGDEEHGSESAQALVRSSLGFDKIQKFCELWEVTPATVIQTAWGLVLKQYTGISRTWFGMLTSGRDLPINGLHQIVGPFIGLLPCHVVMRDSKTILDAMREVQSTYLKSISYQTSSLEAIHNFRNRNSSPLFNTILSFQKAPHGDESHDVVRFIDKKWLDPTDYAVNISVAHRPRSIEIGLNYGSGRISKPTALGLQEALVSTIAELTKSPNRLINEIEVLAPREKKILWQWNKTVPATIHTCVHELIEQRALSQPTAPAICAWDGELTYRDLNNLSTRLAYHLVDLGVRPEVIVPLCFEKSRWTSVAILAVLKAGGAFVLLEPSQPEARLRSVIQRLQPPVILTSITSHGLGTILIPNDGLAVAVGLDSPQLTATPPDHRTTTLPVISASSLMYVVFTSGSTGTPKGVMISHSAFSSATHHQSSYLGLSSASRILDFSAYSFDVAISNHLMTFITGGCLCVPSEEIRKNSITEFMISTKVNVAHFTPSLARTLQPHHFPDLQTLLIGGEAVQIDDVRGWLDVAQMVNAYGPAECTPFSTINPQSSDPTLVPRLGRGVGVVTWVVDPADHDVLLPIGVIGELLLEGPIVGRGYLGDLDKTALAFIENPRWLLEGVDGYPGRQGRLYKTGDLVRYNEDGSLIFIGRKDTQVKIRGQRVELGEVEHHVHACLPQAKELVAEVVVPAGQGAHILAVFMAGIDGLIKSDIQCSQDITDAEAAVILLSTEIEDKLAERLPSYMVPTLFFSIRRFPLTATGKTDRKRIREIGSSFSTHQLAQLRSSLKEKRQPTTEIERTIQALWARVLNLQPNNIGLDDSFFRLGGDSITVMRLVSEARQNGLMLSAVDMFQHPRLVDLSKNVIATTGTKAEDILPFSLLTSTTDVDFYREIVRSAYSLNPEIIQDIYPCTQLQKGLMALTLRLTGSYKLQYILELSPEIEINKFRNAWESVVRSTPILRTRIIQDRDGNLMQLVVDDEIHWVQACDVAEYLVQDNSIPMEIGQPLARYGLVLNSSKQSRWFIWSIHHTLYDGASLSMIIDLVRQAYDNSPLPNHIPFNRFVKALQDIDRLSTVSYWQSKLERYQLAPFPPPLSGGHNIKPDTKLSSYFPMLLAIDSDATLATLVRAAWAIVTSHHTGSNDVVFGATVSGRHAAVVGIERIIGPTIATVPVRIQIPSTGTVAAFLEYVQTIATEMIPYEQAGLQEIAKISEDARQACGFQTLLVVQPPEDIRIKNSFGRWRVNVDAQTFNIYALTLNCFLSDNGINTVATFDSKIIHPWLMERILDQFNSVIQHLANPNVNQGLSDINFLPPKDRNIIWEWNKTVPATIHTCVHELIEQRALLQPTAPAICAWDGDLTYKDLNDLSTRLAYHLVDLGVRPEVIVPLCFEKSRWTSVAILAVLKAGGAFVLLEPSQPEARLRSIIQRLQPPVGGGSWIRLATAAGSSTRPPHYNSPGYQSELINPHRFPDLQTLLIGGEAVQIDDVRGWLDVAQMVNAYGPAECTPFSTINPQSSDPTLVPRIGKGIGAVTWIVDPVDHNILLPLGTTGELLLEGPIVGRGYLGDLDKTALTFIENPRWLLEGVNGYYPGRQGQLYKTGDLVRYNEDGSLTFVGRKDTQVKIRGQRVELGEVEHHVHACLPQAKELAAEVIVPAGQGASSMLAVFMTDMEDLVESEMQCFQDTTDDEASIILLSVQIEDRLAECLPSYMVPTLFFSIRQLPLTATGKTDRKRLREIGSTFSMQQLIELRSSQIKKREPTTEIERTIQALWARVLNLQPANIGLDDSFFRLGGDSITVMRLVTEAQVEGLKVSAVDVFRYPRLGDLARVAILTFSKNNKDVPPFSLVGGAIDVASYRETISSTYMLDPKTIEDVYPCTPLQQGLLALTTKTAGRYVLQNILEINSLNVKRLLDAWSEVVQKTPILRTRIVQHSDGQLMQVVIDEEFRFAESDDLHEYLVRDTGIPTEIGRPLSRYGLVSNSASKQKWFVWSIHHALYDGASLRMIIDLVWQAYSNIPLTKHTPFNQFVRSLQEADHSATTVYWHSMLSGYQSVAFPPLLPVAYDVKPDTKLKSHCPNLLPELASDTTLATLVRAAWAIVTSHHTGSNDVVFGATVSGRHAAVVGIERIIGPTIATVPVRIQIPSTGTVAAFLEYVQTIATEMIPYEQAGLQEIAKISEDARQACGFQTLLVVQPPEDYKTDNELARWRVNTDIQTFNVYTLTLNCFLSDNGGIDTIAIFDSQIIDKWLMRQLLEQFSWTVQQLANARPNQQLSNINFLPPKDRNIIWEWNKTVPATIHTCVHELIEQRALLQPTAPAICAWDGDLTYKDLNDLSTRLAYHLVDLGVRPEVIVPLCFEKSRWTSVAILAVLKAGGAFVLLEPSQPEARLRSIIQRLQPPVILTSIVSYGLGTMLMPNNGLAVAIGLDSPQLTAAPPDYHFLPVISGSSLMYVVFTSGSTGMPKGVMIPHNAFASATYYQSSYLSLSSASRILDFSAYSFDVAISNHLMTFITGGCLCVPSEGTRKDNITEFMSSTKVNIAHFTPSLARTLQPYDFPDLQTLHMGGEAVQVSDVREWLDVVQVINAYGPAECTPICTINANSTNPSLIPRIGKGVGAVTWIVDPVDHNILLPLGTTGELLLEGPIVGRGYLGDLDKTALTFIENPRWLLEGVDGSSGRQGRLYKTGDLVRYNEDGSLTFVGRKDTQVKIRGQRVELGEVEHHVRACLPQAKELAAEVIVPAGQGASSLLAVFMTGMEDLVGNERLVHSDDIIHESRAVMARIPAEVEDRLVERLPSYMVPTLFFAISRLPLMVSGKTDRKRLQEIGSAFSVQQLIEFRSSQIKKQQPTTNHESILQRLWAYVLEIDPAYISIDDSFFRLGGNSITVMRLVSKARTEGFLLSAVDVFRRPRLVDQAQALISTSSIPVDNVPPFSLLSNVFDVSTICDTPSTICALKSEAVQDIYPCTSLQEGLIALTSKFSGSYTLQNILTLSPDLDLPRFRAAWELIVQATPILRTRIVQNSDGRLLQVVVKEEMQWIESDDLQQYLTRDCSTPMTTGQPLSRYSLVNNGSKPCWFVWTIHHALYDGTSLPIIINLVSRAYRKQSFEAPTPYNLFVKYLHDIDRRAMMEFWQTTLSRYESAAFPSVPSISYPLKPDTTLSAHCPRLPEVDSDTTLATLVRAAWAIVTSHHTGSNDVVFGATVSGRHAAVVGIERIIGPTIATVPVRIQIPSTGTVAAFLKYVQTIATEIIPYEQAGLQEIAKISEDARRACGFQTLLVVQPPEDRGINNEFGQWQVNTKINTFNTYALTLQCFLSENSGVDIIATFDSQIIDKWRIQQLLEQFSWAIRQLANSDPDQGISKINVLPTKDRDTIWKWNGILPASINQCVHQLIETRALLQPDAPAVCAWDGELTYKDLNDLSNRLAYHLIDLGIQSEVIVPLCFEKSLWTSVAILAVLKAGGAFVLLDPSQPESRLQTIINQVRPMVILSSAESYDLACDLISDAVIVCVINVAQFTPSLARTLQPHHFQNLRILLLAGEAVQLDDVQEWLDVAQMVNAYGPAECTPYSTMNIQSSDPTLVPRIGKGVGVVTWVVDPADHDVLLPIGVIGELLLEGPIVGRGYLDDLDKTALAFIENPRWLLEGVDGYYPGRQGRLYKTGDLVRYNEDGSLTFVGRKDTQVKIRGQRVELGEVEHHVHACLPQAKELAAEVIVPAGQGASSLLAVFMTGMEDLVESEMQCSQDTTDTDSEDTTDAHSHDTTDAEATVIPLSAEMEDKLAERLPSYMVPAIFFSVRQLPLTATGKTDRKRIREIGSSFSTHQLAQLRSSLKEKRQPTTEIERTIQALWAHVLNLQPANIGLDDSFFRLGGDSIAAMRLVTEARTKGFLLSVGDIFRYPRLSDLATSIRIRCKDNN